MKSPGIGKCRTSTSERGTDMLKLSDLHAAYGQSRALHGVDLEVREGETVCLVGRNGAGKTSTMRAVVQDQIRVTSGGVSFNGCELTGMAPRSEEHTSELQSLMRISYAVFCLKKNKH